jgi:hypothetical protein
MSVWYVIPSKRAKQEADACMNAWRDRGYRTAVIREPADGFLNLTTDLQLRTHSYLGWARSVNLLIGAVMAYDADAEWFATGGDDYFPDPNHTADEIAIDCKKHFTIMGPEPYRGDTFGVMQPTGDRWGEAMRNGVLEATIDRIAGSPWMGREFCRRMYHGGGPLYNGYYHNFADEELQCVAQKLGVFWQRRDLIHEHRHWARSRGDWRDAPEWARKINDPAHSDWDKSKALFAARKAAGFPGHEPLEL